MTGHRNRFLLPAFCIANYLAACGLAPSHSVLPYPGHIQAALSIGDRVEIVMENGDAVDGTVTALTATAITIDSVSHDVENILSIALRSYQVPANPCDDERPLGCSVPAFARVASETHDRFANHFWPSCRQHDYCYRYGTQTYGFDRNECDEKFLDAMEAQCSGRANLDLVWRAECLLAARHFHSAVVRHGEPSFLGARGDYCEYAGPRSEVVGR